MQGETFVTADAPRVNGALCGVQPVRIAWTEDSRRLTERFETCAVHVLQAVRSKVQTQ